MRIALIFPGIALTGFDSYRNLPGTTWIHHGLCMLSACAREAGNQVRLFDIRRVKSYDDERWTDREGHEPSDESDSHLRDRRRGVLPALDRGTVIH